MSETGRIAQWFFERGFGFIKPDKGGDNVFCHVRMFANGSEQNIAADLRVRYVVGKSRRTGKMEAQQIELLDFPTAKTPGPDSAEPAHPTWLRNN
jgi:cold shock CspA family protein